MSPRREVFMADSDDEEGSGSCGLWSGLGMRIGSFLLGFGSVLLLVGVIAAFRALQNHRGSEGRDRAQLESQLARLSDPARSKYPGLASSLPEFSGDVQWVPAISSSAGPPNLDPPPGFSADLQEYGTASDPMPRVRTVNVGSLPYGHPSPSVNYTQYPGFTLWLVEEFDEPIDLNTDPIWTYSDGGLTEGLVRFVKEGIRFEDGKLMVEASNRGLPQGSPCSHAEVGFVGHKYLTSGEFRTRYNLFRFGRYEARLKAPSVQKDNPHVDGNFISTMFVYRDAKFKHWREIDFEVTGDRPNSFTTNVLKADHTSSWNPGIQATQRHYPKGLDVRSQFHIYAFEWLPDKVTWWIDGVVQRVHKGGRVPIPDMSTKIMMNLWIFKSGGFGGAHGYNNRYPIHNEYDWFRFYKWDGDKQYPCLAMDATCLTTDDQYLAGNNPCDGIQQDKLYGRRTCVAPCKL